MRIALPCLALCATLLLGCAATPPAGDRATAEKQVADTERAFAKTMADRDHAAFVGFLSEDTVFFSGTTPLHGKRAVADYWKRFYDKPQAPFSWKPDRVEALDSGTLALSTGPVFDPTGKCIGRYNSIWRLEAPGVWKIIFDKGQGCDE